MSWIRKYFKLNYRDQGLLLLVAFLLVAVRIALYLVPFRLFRKSVLRLLQRQGSRSVEGQPAARRIIWAIETASRLLPGTRHCLTKALVAKLLLVQAGYPSDLRIGVRRSAKGVLEAHAWLESEGRIIVGNLHDLDRFQLFTDLNRDRS